MPPKKTAEPSEPVANAPVQRYDKQLAIDALSRALQVVEHMNLSSWSTNSINMKQSLSLPMEYAIETIKESINVTGS